MPFRFSRRFFLWQSLRGVAFGGTALALGCSHDELEGSIQLLAPQAGQILTPRSTVIIRWKTFIVQKVHLEWSADEGNSWTTIAPEVDAGLREWAWMVPSVANPELLLRVRDSEGRAEAVQIGLQLAQATIRLIAPLGGETYRSETQLPIRWEAPGVGRVRVEISFSNQSSWQQIAPAVPAQTGGIDWQIPELETRVAFVRLSDVDAPSRTVVSTQAFFIRWEKAFRPADFPELSSEGGFVVFPDRFPRGYTVRRLANDQFQVLDHTCTHSGCTVEWKGPENAYACPCHGSRFSAEGCRLSGPAPIGLEELQTIFDPNSGILTIINERLSNRRANC